MIQRTLQWQVLAALCAVMGAAAGCSKAPDPPVTAPAASAASAMSPNVSDIDVTEHVKTALQRNDALKGFDIAVVTLKGDVRLTGVVDTPAQKDEAIGIARAAEGMHAIHDEITVRQ